VSPERTAAEASLIEVFREQREALWAFFRRGAGEPAEDLLQECFVRIWDHRESLAGMTGEEDRDGIRRYLWRAARNLMIDEIRMRHRSRERSGPESGSGKIEGAANGRPGPEDEVAFADAVRVVHETVRALPNERIRRCLQLWLDGGDVRSIAGEVALGVDQVRGLLQRGRSELIRRAADRFRIGEISESPKLGSSR
jgi:RNA polymerase sigma factor (sigma-70 family)